MTYAVVYHSLTGNTKLLADRIRETLGMDNCVYFGGPADGIGNKAAEADIVFAGFWTDKGECSDEMKTVLNQLEGKDIFLFGTAGGGSGAYFDKVLKRVSDLVSGKCNVVGTFMCQGRMPENVKQKYEAMKEKNPEDDTVKRKLWNYEKAYTHPDEADLRKLQESVRKIWKD